MTHTDIRAMTWGELDDLVEGYRYRLYLEAQRDARLACWICNGGGMRDKAMHVSDLIGAWADGRVMSGEDYREHLKEQLIRERRERAEAKAKRRGVR